MRVLFVPRKDANRVFGGDVVQMEATAQALRERGVEVVVDGAERALGEPFDVVHLWTSLHFPRVLMPQLKTLEPLRDQVRIALSTIWAPHQLVLWMAAARRWLIESVPNPADLSPSSAAEQLAQIADRSLNFTVNGRTLTAFTHHPWVVECRKVLKQVDLILPNSYMELAAVFAYLGDFASYAVIPNAVDSELFSNGDPERVPEPLRQGAFALMSGRFDTRKQQDFAVLALKELDVPLVFVGARTDPEVFSRFQTIARTRVAPVYYYPFVPQEELRDLYAAARVHFMPSLFESPGLSSLEAALLDCSVVVGNLGFESEYFQDSAYYCDPCNAGSIARAVARAMERFDVDAERRERLRERIATEYTWDAAGRATLAAYESL